MEYKLYVWKDFDGKGYGASLAVAIATSKRQAISIIVKGSDPKKEMPLYDQRLRAGLQACKPDVYDLNKPMGFMASYWE